MYKGNPLASVRDSGCQDRRTEPSGFQLAFTLPTGLVGTVFYYKTYIVG